MKKIAVIMLILISAGLFLSAFPVSPRHLIYIVWDGTRLDKLIEAKTPFLDSLPFFYNNIVVTDHYTVTDPGFATLLSGTTDHGIKDNALNAIIPPEIPTVFKLLPSRVIKGMICGRNSCIPPSAHSFPGLLLKFSIPYIDYYFEPVASDSSTKINAYGSGDYINPRKKFDVRATYTTNNKIIPFMRAHKNQDYFLFIQFCDPDSRGHEAYVVSYDYIFAIEECDINLGKIINEMSSGSQLVVTSDHGFGEFNFHWSLPYPDGNPNCWNVWCASNYDLKIPKGTYFEQKNLLNKVLKNIGFTW